MVLRSRFVITTLLHLMITAVASGAPEAEGVPSIAVGFKLSDAQAILEHHDIKVKEYSAAVVPKDRKSSHLFIVLPQYESRDALIIVAGAGGKDGELVVTGLCWHLLYQDDSKQPKSMRANRFLKLHSIDVDVLLPEERGYDAVQRVP